MLPSPNRKRVGVHESLSRLAQDSLTLRPAGSLSRPRRPLSRGSSPPSHPDEPLVSFQTYRHLSSVESSSTGSTRPQGALRFPFERLAWPGDGKGMRSTKRAVSFADPRALQAFASPSQTFPNLRLSSPNISKDSFVRFVGNQGLAGGKRNFRFAANFCAARPTKACAPPPRQGGAATTILRRMARLPFFRNTKPGSGTAAVRMACRTGVLVNRKP
jgi:hypothetical protein